jgi:hypothetical protein
MQSAREKQCGTSNEDVPKSKERQHAETPAADHAKHKEKQRGEKTKAEKKLEADHSKHKEMQRGEKTIEKMEADHSKISTKGHVSHAGAQIEVSKPTPKLRKRHNSRKKGDAWKGAKGSGSLALDILKQQQAENSRAHQPLWASAGPGMDAESNSVMAAEIEAKLQQRRQREERERLRVQREQIEVSTCCTTLDIIIALTGNFCHSSLTSSGLEQCRQT